MKKVIRLTESDLTRIVRRVLLEQSEENFEDPKSNEYQGPEFDFWYKIVTPSLSSLGFRKGKEPMPSYGGKCYGGCCDYLYYPDHDNGVNVFLECGPKGDSSRKIVVYYKGNQGVKKFDASINSKKAANDAVSYAKMLKSKLTESDLTRIARRVIKEQSQISPEQWK